MKNGLIDYLLFIYLLGGRTEVFLDDFDRYLLYDMIDHIDGWGSQER